MYIQFYGHSITERHSPNNGVIYNIKPFVQTILDHYQSQHDDSYIGISMCSEERILKNIKKTKDPDIAIIFHGHPKFYHLYSNSRDFIKENEEDTRNTAQHNAVQIIKSEKVQISKEIFFNTLYTYNEKFYDADTEKNRFIGALLQIDSYLKFKNIKTIHCPMLPDHIPKWFKFQSGITDISISSYQDVKIIHYDGTKSLNPYNVNYNQSFNGINQEGNDIISSKLIKYIDDLIIK